MARFNHKGSMIADKAVQPPAADPPVNDVDNDFNGDGRSDVLWRDNSGTVHEWLGQSNGGFVLNSGAQNFLPTTWHAVSTGDFNGDTRDDVLWRHNSGRIIEWLSQPDGSFLLNSPVGYEVSTSWHIVGTGDFNADNRDDLLWMNDDGIISNWLGQADGTFHINSGTFVADVPSEWHVVGIGDFNGDGRDDIMWKNNSGIISNWLGQGEGSFVSNANNFVFGVPTEWHIVGFGDFNGDNRDDILWQSDSGVLTNWLGEANGSFTFNNDDFVVGVAAEWHVTAIGDYNGDNRDDILWRSDGGLVSDWLGNTDGSFTLNGANFVAQVPNDWTVQPEVTLLF